MSMNTAPRKTEVGWRTIVAASLLALATPLLWPGVLRHFFESGYMPHGHCYLWTPALVSLHLVSDLLIGTAYVAISASLVYLVYKTRRDIPFHWIILVFGVFIVACGATHLMEVWTIWNATYWMSGAVKMITAIASVGAAALMPVVIPGIRGVLGDARVSRQHQRNLEAAHEELTAAYARIRITDAVIRNEHRYMSALISNLHEQIIVCDSEGNVVFANRPARQLVTGERYPTAVEMMRDLEMAGAETGERLPEEERPIMRAIHGETVKDFPVRFRREGGEWRFGVINAQPVVDESGGRIGAMGVLRDVTDERVADAALSDLVRQNDVILRAAGEGICGIDAEGRTTLMNPAAEAISGWPFQELRGRVHHDQLHHTRPDGSPYPWEECPAYLTLHDGQPRRVTDEVYWRADGTWFPVEFHVNPVRENDTIAGAVITFQDVSHRKRLEQDLEQSRRVESLGRLAATIAHEFNNVLMSIQPFVEVIGAQASDNTVIRKSLNYISSAVQRGKKVSHEILRFTQPAEPVLEKIDVHVWAGDLIDQAKAILGPRIQVELDLSMDVEGVLGDAAQLHQVFLNLLLNARDAMPGGGTIRFTARCVGERSEYTFGSVPAHQELVHFTVSDTGKGISPEVMNHLFEPLFTTKKVGGTGLGLALVRQVITRHGGHVFAESRRGEGAAFHVFLRASEAPPPAAASTRRRGTLAGRKVLLVEDEYAVSAGIELLLEMEGMEVQIVDRGAYAVGAIEEFGPDAVVLDVGLPDIAGDQLYIKIAARWPSLAVIFSTGHADPTALGEHLQNTNVAFLTKPYQAEDLLAVIENLLSGRPR